MFDFKDAVLSKVIIHKVGNKEKSEEIVLSHNQLNLNADVKNILKHYFLNQFKSDAFYSFHHDSDIQLNKIYNFASQIFENQTQFTKLSQHIAEHLYESGNHPKIKSGEIYIATFENCTIDDEVCDIITIVKSENKDTYFKIYENNNGIDLQLHNGININKTDKACLIFNTEKNLGYKVCIIDNVSKTTEAQYWRETFLGIKQRPDDFYQTQNYLSLCKNFVDEVYNKDNEVDKPDQIDFINKSVNYFKENKVFDNETFDNEVLTTPAIKNAFDEYKNYYADNNNIAFNESFDISENAVKKTKAQLKSVLKLDKNFHIYIHGGRDKIEKGFDDINGLNYYRIYFESEE